MISGRMDIGTAHALLGLSEPVVQENVMERLDAEAFAVRDHFMRQPIVPTLFRSRVNRLVQLSDVARVLNVEPLGAPVELPKLLPSGSNFVLLVRNHVENIRRLRTAMAGTLDPDVLVRFGNALCNLQLRYMEEFLALSVDSANLDIDLDPIPARDEMDWQSLLASIEGKTEEDRLVIVKERRRMAQILERETT
tara:strand:+ start:1936 stop:2517 length:582 start_codon:yes stop_codon:yes gene_type:complete